MARGEYLLGGESYALPPGAALSEALYRPFAVGAVLRRSGNQMRNRLAVPGYGNGLSVLDRSKEFCQACLGFGGLNLTHISLQPVVVTIPWYQLSTNQVNDEDVNRLRAEPEGRPVSTSTFSTRPTGRPWRPATMRSRSSKSRSSWMEDIGG